MNELQSIIKGRVAYLYKYLIFTQSFEGTLEGTYDYLFTLIGLSNEFNPQISCV